MDQEQKHRLEQDTMDHKMIQEKLQKMAEQNEDVKSGKISIEDELKEPGYVLYGAILKSTTDILRTPETKKTFDQISSKFGEELTASMMEFFAAAITQSSYNAVIFYNDLLKQELDQQFKLMGGPLNTCIADVKAHHSVLASFGKRLTALESKDKVDGIKKDLTVDNPAE